MNVSQRWFVSGFGALLAACVFCSDVAAQPGGGGRGGRQGMRGFGRMRDNSLGLLRRDDVRKELELVDDQVKKLDQLQQDMMTQMRGGMRMGGFRDLSQEERQKRIAEMRQNMEKAQKEMETKVGEILLPVQNERLAQIKLQMSLRRSDTARVLTGEKVAEALGLSEEQKKTLTEAQEASRKELQEQIAKLRREAEEKVLKVLSAEQQEKWQKLIGKPFESQPRERRGGRRGRGENRPPPPGPPATDI